MSQATPFSATDSAALFNKKAMDIAKSPFSSLFMRAFMMYMVGSNIHLFSIIAVATALWQPLKAIVDTNAAFEGVKHGDVDLTGPKLMYIAINLAGLAMGFYKLGATSLVNAVSVRLCPSALFDVMPTFMSGICVGRNNGAVAGHQCGLVQFVNNSKSRRVQRWRLVLSDSLLSLVISSCTVVQKCVTTHRENM